MPTSSAQASASGTANAVVRALRITIASVLAICLLSAVAGTIHWPVAGDATLSRYIVFLIGHGKAPYREIIDYNMPGTYALEYGVIRLLGPGAVAWRVFDLALLALCMLAMVAITLPADWLAGFFAGSLFALLHLRDGPTQAGQRDLMMTAMLLAACACLFHAVRRQRPGAAAAAGIFLGMATMIKPFGLLFAVALGVLLWMQLRHLRRAKTAYLLAAAGGYLLPLLAAVAYLLRHHALAAFLAINRSLSVYNGLLGRQSLLELVLGCVPLVLLGILLPALPLFVARRPWRHWEGMALAACVLCGAASYIAQGKGYPYHRYPIAAFLLLIAALLLLPAVRHTRWMRLAGWAGILAGTLYFAPVSTVIACHYDWHNQEFNNMLAADLNTLGGQQLNSKLQCIDMTSGCLTTLYNLHLVQATGYLYDCYMMQPQQTPASLRYREGFWEQIQANPPLVYIVTDQECFTDNHSWARLQRWPQFQALLDSDYTLIAQRTPPHTVGWWRTPAVPPSYRIYIRNTPPARP